MPKLNREKWIEVASTKSKSAELSTVKQMERSNRRNENTYALRCLVGVM